MVRKALGRGLGALISGADTADEKDAIHYLSPSMIHSNPFQPRRDFPAESIDSLARSLKEHGMLQPLLVRKTDDGYELISGERRLRAAAKAGLPLVPAIIESADDKKMLLMALVENIQREDLNPIEEASAYRELMEKFNLSQVEVARQVGKDRSTVANALRLLKLPAEVQQLIASGKITAGHARSLLSLGSAEEQLALARAIVRDNLSVRDVEKQSRKKRGKRSAGGIGRKPVSPELADLEEKLRRRLATKVTIKPARGKGVIEIEYYGDDDLNRIVELIGLNL